MEGEEVGLYLQRIASASRPTKMRNAMRRGWSTYTSLILAIAAALIAAGALTVGVVRAESEWSSLINIEKVQAANDTKCGGITYIAKTPLPEYPRAAAPPSWLTGTFGGPR